MDGDDLLKHFFIGFVRLHILHHLAIEPIGADEMTKNWHDIGTNSAQTHTTQSNPTLPNREVSRLSLKW